MKKISMALGLLALSVSFMSCEKDDECWCDYMRRHPCYEQGDRRDTTNVEQDKNTFIGSTWRCYGYDSRYIINIVDETHYTYARDFGDSVHQLSGLYQRDEDVVNFFPYVEDEIHEISVGYIKDNILYFPAEYNIREFAFELISK